MVIDASDSSESVFASLLESSALRAWYEEKSEVVLGMLCDRDDCADDLYQVGRDLYAPKSEFDLLFGGDCGLVSVWMVVNSVYGSPNEAEILDKLVKFLSRGGTIVSLGFPNV